MIGRSLNTRWQQRMLIIASVILVVFLGLGSSLPVQALQATSTFTTAPCMFSVSAGYTEGRDLQCGWLTVPETYENPGGQTIQLVVAIFKSRAANPQPDPLVMLQGGPGGSTIDTYSQLIPLDPRLRSLNRDIILFDQRGTMYSKPSLFCQEYYDMTVRTLNQDLSKDQANQEQQAALKACHDRFVKQGVNLSAYNSLENAADVDALTKALGYRQINLYGVSYGTLLALHVMRQFPQDLRSVTIDSVVPPQTNFIADAPQSENRSLNAVFSTCSNDPQCNSAYPNLSQVFYNLVDQLNAKKAHIQLTDFKTGQTYPALLDGDTFLSAVGEMLYQTDLIPVIPRVIYEARSGDYSFVEKILSLVALDRTINYGMYFSVLCAEDADFNPQQVNLNALPKQLYEAEKDSAAQFLQTCSFWKVKDLSPAIDQPVTSNIPTLVLSGAFDPVTPPAYAQEAAKTLSNSYFFEFPIGGHGEVTSGECQDSIFLQFLNNPAQKPNGDCIAAEKMQFSTPGSLIRLPVLANLLNLQSKATAELIVYGLALLLLLSALIIYPVVWIVRLFRRPAARPVGSTPSAPETYTTQGTAPINSLPASQSAARLSRPRPILYRLGPWLAALTGIFLLSFMIAVSVISIRMALQNDNRILLGLPGSARPWFILPILAAIFALLMLAGAVIAWARRSGSTWGRVYFTLLTLAALVCLVVLGVWGMLTSLFVS